MKHLPFVQVYDVALARLREAVDARFDTLEAAKVTPLERRQLMCDCVHWMTGAIHQWHATLQVLHVLATDAPGLERSALAAKVEVDRRRIELEIAGRMDRLYRAP
jgi:hypothetical protein